MICPKCGLSGPDDSEFCQYCGVKLSEASISDSNADVAKAPELAGKTCPFCKAPFLEGEAVVICNHCEMPHHLDCWKENGGCTTFGCTGNIGKIIGAEQKDAQSAPVATKKPVNAERIPYPRTKDNEEQKLRVKPQPVSNSPRQDTKPSYTILEENTEQVLQGNLPVVLEKTVLYKGTDGKVFVAGCFRSLSDKTINALLVDVTCADVWREKLQPVKGFQYLDLKVSRDDLFGGDVIIMLPDPNTRVVEISIQKIMFSDGTLLQRGAENIKIPDANLLVNSLGRELFEEYRSQTFHNAKYMPTRIGAFWRCTCGAMNGEKEGRCHSCGDYLETLIGHLDKESLQRTVDEKKRLQREKEERERIAREEALRRQREEEERLRKELRPKRLSAEGLQQRKQRERRLLRKSARG